MNYIFFGTPKFANIVLKDLIESDFKPSLVVCNPDRPVGRDQIMTSPPTKETAEKHNIDVYQPEKLTVEELKNKAPNPDFAVLAAYGKIIPETVIDYLPNGIIGVHPSLLPKYRGPTPIRSAMLDGVEETGTTLYLIDEKIDNGPILSQETLLVDKKTYPKLKEELAHQGAEMIQRDALKLVKGNIDPKPQNHEEAIYTKFIQSDDAKIDYGDLIKASKGDQELSELIDRKIRSLNPEPGTWTKTNEKQILSLPKNKRIKLLESHIENDKLVLDKIHVAGKSKPRKINN